MKHTNKPRVTLGVISDKLDTLTQTFGGLVQTTGGLVQDVGILKQDVGTLKQDVGTLKQDVGVLKQDVGVLKQDVGVLKQDVGVLKQDMGIVKEDIKGLKGLYEKTDDIIEAVQTLATDTEEHFAKQDMRIVNGFNNVDNELRELKRVSLPNSGLRIA